MGVVKQIVAELKENILRDYLSGMHHSEIAGKYGFKNPRTVYWHLQPLSQEDKKLHLQNRKRLKK